MNIRLKILCLLFGLVYLFVIGEHLISGIVPSFTAGYKAGSSGEKNETLFFQAKPVEGYYSYPTSLTNLKTGEPVQAEMYDFNVKISQPIPLPAWIETVNGLFLIAGFFVIVLLIYIPFQVYRVIRSIVQNDIFDPKNITRIRRTGYAMLVYVGYEVGYKMIYVIKSQMLVGLENYKIVFSISDEYTLILFGLMVLLFAEVLKISHTMKEEVDLTV